jgi:hypothetical protein
MIENINEPLVIHVVLEQGVEKRGHFSFRMDLARTTSVEAEQMLELIKSRLANRLDEIFSHYRIIKNAQS